MLQHPKGLPRKMLRTQKQLMMQQLCPKWRPTMPLRPQRWLKTQHCPQRLSFRRLALVGGGGGRLPLPHMARRPSRSSLSARRLFQSPLLARRPSLSHPSSSPCRRLPTASPCRRLPSASPCRGLPGFLSCRAHPGRLPSCWLTGKASCTLTDFPLELFISLECLVSDRHSLSYRG